MMSFARALIASALVVLLAGCVTVANEGGFPPGLKVPPNGGPLAADAWESLPAEETGAVVRRRTEASWALPLSIYQRSVRLTEAGTHLRTERIAYNDLLSFFFWLPLRMSYDRHDYARAEASPEWSQKVRWNLFWASASSTKPGEHLDAAGVPLFFSMLEYQAADQSVNFWQALWSLGPAYLNFDIRDVESTNTETPPRPVERLEGTVGMPLLLGGPLGAIVWLDVAAKMDAAPDAGTATVHLHGPLFGSLGLVQIRSEAANRSEFRDGDLHFGDAEDHRMLFRMVLWGILWTDRMVQRTEDPATVNSSHGPLWGCVGWGEKNGKTAVRLLWIPIVLPFQ